MSSEDLTDASKDDEHAAAVEILISAASPQAARNPSSWGQLAHQWERKVRKMLGYKTP
jgi:hypothetical protein